MKKFLITCAAIFILMSGSAKASDAEFILNNAELNPTLAGEDYCDEIVQETLNQVTRLALERMD